MSDAAPEFKTLWDTQKLAARTMTLSATQTLVPSHPLVEPHRSTPELPRILSTTRNATQLEVVGEIGQGGMGVIRLARQLALQRDVAIKQVRDDRRTARTAEELTTEGLLVGALEHPNIVPVYMLGQDDDGFPTLVMRRIEGVSWLEVMKQTSESVGPGPDDDALEWHLDVLMQVANAVHFAHSRDIVHRDLKPENVMVGSYGEVYVLDWGIAVSLDESGEHPFPRASQAQQVAGTPAYMAPEMVVGDGNMLGPRTDVYLLGAILHEIVTGEVRHRGEKIFEVMRSAFESKPVEYEDVAPELGRICNRATAREPEERFENAEELRRAIATFLRHRESIKLTERANERAARLDEVLDTESVGDETYEVFQEALFGYDAALEAWSDNEDAQDGRRELLERMFEYELEAEDARGARRILTLLGDSTPEKEASVEKLESLAAKRREAEEKLEEFRFDRDIGVQARWRAIFHVTTGAFWFFAALIYYLTGEQASHWWVVVAAVGGMTAGGTILVWKREVFIPNEVGRQLMSLYFVSLVMLTAGHLVVDLSRSPIWLAFTFDSLIFATVLGAMALTLNPLMFIASFLYIAVAVSSAYWSESAFYIVAIGVFLVQIVIAFADFKFADKVA